VSSTARNSLSQLEDVDASSKGKRSGYLIWRCLHEKTREQQRFTILEVAADWHELMVPRRGMQPSTARDSGQVDPRRSTTDIPPPQSAALSLHPVVRRLLLINRPRRDGTLSWGWYIAATGTRPPRTFRLVNVFNGRLDG